VGPLGQWWQLAWQKRMPVTSNTAGRGVYLPQGKILGGSTSLNGLVYNRGQAEDFDHWASLGNAGWSYQDVLPYFRKSETFEAPNSQYRGSSGPLRIGNPQQTHPLCDQFIESVAALADVPRHHEYNGATQAGTGYYQRFIHKGKRENVATRYLTPQLKKRNITLLTDAEVTRIRVENKRVIGVDALHKSRQCQFNANKEVIVCAGTINSAALLQRSGIADGAHLQSIGLPVVHDLPGVGQNLQDHFFARLAFRLPDGVDSLNLQSRGWRLGREIARWLFGQPSILAWSPSIAYAFINAEAMLSGQSSVGKRPDLQFVFSHGSYQPGKIYELDSFPAVTCGFTQQRPYSSGFVKISSANHQQNPMVQPNYLADERDRRMAIIGVKLARRIMRSSEFSAVFRNEQFPGESVDSDEEILDFVRTTGNTGYHLVGTCKMGEASDRLAVVDTNLCVHGLDGVRVVDASVMPAVTSSNTCAATIMIAEKGADAVLARQLVN